MLALNYLKKKIINNTLILYTAMNCILYIVKSCVTQILHSSLYPAIRLTLVCGNCLCLVLLNFMMSVYVYY